MSSTPNAPPRSTVRLRQTTHARLIELATSCKTPTRGPHTE